MLKLNSEPYEMKKLVDPGLDKIVFQIIFVDSTITVEVSVSIYTVFFSPCWAVKARVETTVHVVFSEMIKIF